MSFSCGCHILPGSDVTPEMLQQHLQHTFEAMLFWEVLSRRTRDGSDETRKLLLGVFRQRYLDLVPELYPESVREPVQEKAQAANPA